MLDRLPLTLGLLALLALPALAQDQEKVAPPLPGQKATDFPGPPPQFVVIFKVDKEKGEITLTESRYQMVPVARVEEVKQGNQKVLVQKTTMEAVPTQESRLFPLKEVTFSDTKGKKVPQEKALEQLKPGTVVMVTTGKGKLSPEYLQLFRDNVLIVGLPYPGFAPVGLQPRRGPIGVLQAEPRAAPPLGDAPILPPKNE